MYFNMTTPFYLHIKKIFPFMTLSLVNQTDPSDFVAYTLVGHAAWKPGFDLMPI